MISSWSWPTGIRKNPSLDEVAFEMADIYIYLTRLATKLEVDLPQYVEDKININEERYPVDKVQGSSRKYNEYE